MSERDFEKCLNGVIIDHIKHKYRKLHLQAPNRSETAVTYRRFGLLHKNFLIHNSSDDSLPSNYVSGDHLETRGTGTESDNLTPTFAGESVNISLL